MLIGDVWKDTKTNPIKPWAVQGPGAVARFRTKEEAEQVAGLFLSVIAQRLEEERNITDARNYQSDEPDPGIESGESSGSGI